MQNENEKRELRSIFNLITAFRRLEPDMPMTQAICFVWVALNEGRTQVELRQALDMPSATSSRNLAALSKVHRLGKPGLDLIEWVENPEDRRAKMLYLTKRGKHVAATLMDTIR